LRRVLSEEGLIFDFFFIIGSIVLYFFDLITDWLNAVAYLFREDDEDNLFYFYLTIVVIVFPSLIMHVSKKRCLLTFYRFKFYE